MIENIPFINKDIVRENFNDMSNKNYRKKDMFWVTTGGSTGLPMKFLQSKNIWKRELAKSKVLLEEYGYLPMMPRVSFRGGEFSFKDDNIFWKENPIYNETHFSPFHLSSKTVNYYVEKLNDINAKIFWTYPSSLLLLIDCMENNNISLENSPDIILLISESINLYESEKIVSYFNQSKVIMTYGHSERLIWATTDNMTLDEYKVDRRYGLFELIGDDGRNIDNNTTTGEIVGTSFENWAMPLIRYRTEDITKYISSDKYIVDRVDGRWKQEYIDGYDGSKVFLTALNMHSDIFEYVKQYQFRQIAIGEVELLLIVASSYTKKDESSILTALKNKVGNNIHFSIKYVDKLILTQRGKVKKIVKEGIVDE